MFHTQHKHQLVDCAHPYNLDISTISFKDKHERGGEVKLQDVKVIIIKRQKHTKEEKKRKRSHEMGDIKIYIKCY
jgi:hypothetical protein